MSANQWATAISDLIKKRTDKVPEGWLTREQISNKIGRNKSTTIAYISKLMQQNKADKKEFYIYIAERKTSVPVPHYKLK